MILIIIAVFLFIGLFWSIRAEFSFLLSRDGAHLCLRFRIFYQWVPIRLERHVPLDEVYPFKSENFLGPLFRRKKRKRKRRFRLPKESIRLTEFSVRGGLGIDGDAFLCVLLTGAFQIFFENLKCFLRAPLGSIEIRPFFDRDTLWMKLEGIACIQSAKIILDLILPQKLRSK